MDRAISASYVPLFQSGFRFVQPAQNLSIISFPSFERSSAKERAIPPELRLIFPIDPSQRIVRNGLSKALLNGNQSDTVGMHDTCVHGHPALACADRYLDRPASETWRRLGNRGLGRVSFPESPPDCSTGSRLERNKWLWKMGKYFGGTRVRIAEAAARWRVR